MIDKDQQIHLGQVAKPHGVDGEVLIRMLAQWENYEPAPDFIFLELHGGLVPFEVKALRYRHSHDLLVLLGRINGQEQARQLQGTAVYIAAEDLGEAPQEEKRSLNLLTGFQVNEQRRGSLGKIQAVIEIQNNPLIELLINEKEVLIPLQEDFIVHIDWKKRELTMQLPEGLIELYLE